MKKTFLTLSIILFLNCEKNVDNLKNYQIILFPSEERILGITAEMLRFIPDDNLSMSPENNTSNDEENINTVTFNIYLFVEDNCSECYSIETYEINGNDRNVNVKGGYPLGIQYGIAHVLELIGYRFFSPYYAFKPEKIDVEKVDTKYHSAVSPFYKNIFYPEMSKRGLHLHTLHPIEALFDFWLGDSNENAFRVIDWLIKNRGNYIQWVALNDITDPIRYEAWKKKTTEIINYAHSRGVKTGINSQVFAKSSLQNAYIVNNENSLIALTYPNFDLLNLSFGEFFAEDPQIFIDEVTKIRDMVLGNNPEMELTGTIHVGNFDNLWVEYNNERLLYYFLLKYVDGIIPWVHTVMYYNLFDTAGGAYNHTDFLLHREFLLNYLSSNRDVAYFPESAYWIAFDNSVPQYFPVYILSRWIDIYGLKTWAEMNGINKLKEHILFSSGWEWGYWQNDYTILRMNFRLPVTWHEVVEEMFEVFGEEGEKLSTAVIRTGEMQYDYLIRRGLAPYIAGEDFYIDIGRQIGIISQPDNISFEELLNMTPEERDDFNNNVINNLNHYSEELEELYKIVKDINLHNRIYEEILDGIEIDKLRARFVLNLYSATIRFSQGDDYSSELENAGKILESARKVTERRRASLYYSTPDILISTVDNPTIYKFGYLKQADSLCLWEREVSKFMNATGSNASIPTCIE